VKFYDFKLDEPNIAITHLVWIETPREKPFHEATPSMVCCVLAPAPEPVDIFTELPTMGAKTHGGLWDDSEAAGFVRGGPFLVNNLEAVEVEQLGPESQLVLFAHVRAPPC
jgi:hypothetical protein